jgi:hypothetical protein
VILVQHVPADAHDHRPVAADQRPEGVSGALRVTLEEHMEEFLVTAVAGAGCCTESRMGAVPTRQRSGCHEILPLDHPGFSA